MVVNGVWLVDGGDLPEEHVNPAGGRVDGGNRSLRHLQAGAEFTGLRPGLAAVLGNRGVDRCFLIVAIKLGVEEVHVTAADGLAINFACGGSSRARHIHCNPRLVEKLPGVAAIHHRGADVEERVSAAVGGRLHRSVAVRFIVLVLERSHEDAAGRVVAAVKYQAAVVEQPVRSGPHRGVGRGREVVQWRSFAHGRAVLRKSGQQRASPCVAAVDGGVHAQPGVAQFPRRAGKGDVDGAVVVRSCQQVLRIAAGDRHRGLVLSLGKRIAVRKGGAEHHVHVRTRNLAEHGRGQQHGGGCHPEQLTRGDRSNVHNSSCSAHRPARTMYSCPAQQSRRC